MNHLEGINQLKNQYVVMRHGKSKVNEQETILNHHDALSIESIYVKMQRWGGDYMKTMTCKQLHGPCDVLIHGKTAEEMMQNSQKHGMEMAAKGDKEHMEIMEAMKHHMDDPEAVKQFMEKFHNDFAAMPEDK